jgi:hypothetical protein
VRRSCALLLALWLLTLTPALSSAQSLDSRRLAKPHPLALRLEQDPSKPLFAVGISGGFTGAQMLASVYRNGRVLTIRRGAGNSSVPAETRVSLSLSAVAAVLTAAQRSHVFAIPRSVQDAVFGADIPVLSLRIATTRGQRSVHAMGGETTHAAGSQTFFPIWSLLYAIAGYPPQILRTTGM